MTRGRFLRLQTQEPSETAEKVVFQKKLKILGVLKCINQQERGLRSDSRGPFFYDYIGVLKKVDFFSGLGRFLRLETQEPSPCLLESKSVCELFNGERVDFIQYLVPETIKSAVGIRPRS